MYLNIISRHAPKYQKLFDELLAIEDFDFDPSLFHVGDTLILQLSTRNVVELNLLEVEGITGIYKYDAGAFPPESIFVNTLGFKLRVVERMHTLNRRGASNEPTQFDHSISIAATAISEDVERVLGQFLEILAVEEGWESMEISTGGEGISLLGALEQEHKNEVDLKNRSGKV